MEFGHQYGQPQQKLYHYSYEYPSGVNNKFPWKLWRIVNECRTDAIRWGDTGRTVIINKERFQAEYLDPPSKVFKTTNIGSFIRQLNLYGFRKVQPACRHYPYDHSGEDQPDIQEFFSDNFKRDRPDLVNELKRHVGVRKAKDCAARKRFFESLDNQKVKVKKSCHPQNENVNLTQFKLQKMPGAATGFSRPLGCPTIGTLRPVQTDNNNSDSYKEMIENRTPAVVAFPKFDETKPYQGMTEPPMLMEWSTIHKKWIPAPAPPMNMFRKPFYKGCGPTLVENPLQRMSREEFNNLVTAVGNAMQLMPGEEGNEPTTMPFLDMGAPSNYSYHFNPHDDSPFLPMMKRESDEDDEAIEIIHTDSQPELLRAGPSLLNATLLVNNTVEIMREDGPLTQAMYGLEVESHYNTN